MACGGCGGGNIRIAPRTSTVVIPRPVPVNRDLQPRPIRRSGVSGVSVDNGIKVRPMSITKSAKIRADDTKLCPSCGAILSIEYKGKTRRKRYRCNQCRTTFSQ